MKNDIDMQLCFSKQLSKYDNDLSCLMYTVIFETYLSK